EGEALMWFTSLTASEMSSFDIVAERFISHFDYLIPQPPTLIDLVNEKMSPGEDFLDFAIRWQGMASRSEAIIPESQAVTLMIKNAIPQLRDILIFSDLRTIPQLCNRARIIQTQLTESMMPDYNTEDSIIGRPVNTIQSQPRRPNRRSRSAHQHQFNHAPTLHQQQPG